MALTPAIGHVQSTDAKTLTLVDQSDYTESGVPITNYSRVVELWTGKDTTGSLIVSLPFVGSNLTVNYDIDADQYFSAKLILTGSPTVAAAIQNFTTNQYEYNKLNVLNAKGCGCFNKSMSEKVRYGFLNLVLAEKATMAGNSALANINITNSYRWLTS